jgi:hypothetical protein
MQRDRKFVLYTLYAVLGILLAGSLGYAIVSHPAAQINQGIFGDDVGRGNYTFPEKLWVNTTLGVGTNNPSQKMEVSNGSQGVTIAPERTLINTTNSTNLTLTSSDGNVIIKLG